MNDIDDLRCCGTCGHFCFERSECCFESFEDYGHPRMGVHESCRQWVCGFLDTGNEQKETEENFS